MITHNIWVVEDDTGFRRTLQKLLNREEHLSCDQVFPSCAELFEAIATRAHPDLLLMDLGLPGMGGVEGIRKLSELAPNLAVVVLTVSSEKEKVLESLDAGAAGYLLKSATPREIVRGVRAACEGGTPLSPTVARVVLGEIRKSKPTEDFDLSPREIQVLERLAEGLSIKEIAAVLGIARSTAAGHLEKIYAKLQVQSQSGAVAKALRAGIV